MCATRQGSRVRTVPLPFLFCEGGLFMSKYGREDLIRMVREDDVAFIRMQFTDISAG